MSLYVVVTQHISILILARVLIHRTPCTNITPTEVTTMYIDIIRLLHNAVVDRYRTTLRKDLLDSLTLSRCAKQLLHRAKERSMVGQMLFKCLNNIAHLPNEDSRVPQKFAALQKCLSKFTDRFLGKTLNLTYLLRVGTLNISVACLWARRLNTYSHQSIAILDKLQRTLHHLHKLYLIEY